MAEAGTKARGRPAKEKGSKPLPRTWRSTERLAGVLAYLEVSEDGPNANLEIDAKAKFPDQLQFVHNEVKEFEESKHKWGGGNGTYTYTLEEAKTRRIEGATCILDNFKLVRKVCNNIISPVYYRLHDKSGNPETGTNREKMIKAILDELVPEEPDAVDITQDADVNDSTTGDAAGNQDQTAGAEEFLTQTDKPASTSQGKKKVEPKKKVPKENNAAHVQECMLTWLHLGPLAQSPGSVHPQFQVADKPGKKKSSTRKPTSRQAKREAVLEGLNVYGGHLPIFHMLTQCI